ncbi:MAG: outer membrane protein assembly factor BamA [Parachlamydia sp.]|nr:MAG: outer membrane protein assembly factor BamA [Parachlamydia sp.]
MKKISCYSLYILAFFLLYSGALSADAYQYEGQIIEKIQIINGNSASTLPIDENAIKTRLKTREKDIFSHANFDQDLKMLAFEFDHVEPFLENAGKNINLVLKVWPKPMIRAIRWCGNAKIEQSILQEELKIKPLTIFDRLAFNKAFQAVKAYYVKKGFFEAQLDYAIKFNDAANEVEIEIQVNEGRAGKIKRIKLCGLSAEEQDEILEQMVTKEYCFFTSWLTEEGTYREEAMQHDQYVILNYLQNKGYADASVNIRVDESTQADRIVIYVLAKKGPLYVFGDVSFEGNTLFPDETIWEQISFERGSRYSPDAILATVRNIANCYGRLGYIDAYVDYEPRLNSDNCSYSLHLKIQEGQQSFVGLIKVLGNCSTQTNVILHETLLVPGEVFNIDKMISTETRLKNIGYFSNVNVYAVKSGACLEGNYRDLHIEVEETSTGRFGLALGYSTVESLFGSINVTENNFNYKGLSCLFKNGYPALRGGGEFLSLNATIGAKSRSYSLSWAKPFFMDTPWLVGFDLERSTNRYISSDYEINASQFVSHAVYTVNAFLKTGVHYRLRDSHVHVDKDHKHQDEVFDDTPEGRQKAAAAKAKKDSRNESLEKAVKNGGIISALGCSLIYDSSNHPDNPRCGFKSRLDMELAGFGGRHHFGSLSYVNAYFYPVSPNGTIRLRADIRFIQPFFKSRWDTLPIDERLFLGGNNTVRGFRAYKLGPYNREDKEPLGGLSMQFFSAEYAYDFNSRVEGFFYCDSGHLSKNTWDCAWDSDRFYTAVGVGTRLQVIPNGPPLTIGMGIPFNAKYRGQIKRFFLTVGGRF